ncbi:MAG: polysaccharide biosynthesis tyrosine autokinase [Bryobacterales bacterium]|nr:polysaccharide biosynthesis tyrosine autokinase [Bryobacterales bacterium]
MHPGSRKQVQALASYGPPPPRQPSEDAVPVSQYLAALLRHKWRIVLFATLCGIVALIVSLKVTPLYESIAVIDIDRNSEVEAVGGDSRPAAQANAEQFISTQIRLVQSDAVLRPVAQKYDLPLEQTDAWFAPLREDEQAARAMAPARLKRLKVTHPPQTFLIYIQYRSQNPHLAAQVANEIAQSYIDHVFRIRYESSQTLSAFMERQLDELRTKMERSNAALAAFERELNMIDPEERTSIISSRLLQLNAEFTQAQTERVKREAAFRALSQGSMEAAIMSLHGQRLQELQRRQQELLETFAKVRQHYGPNHPAYGAAKAELDQVTATLEKATSSVQRQIGLGFEEAVQREGLLDKELRDTKAEFDRLNASSFQYKTLKREADADRKLYEELVAKTKQATINAGFPSSAIRIADLARPAYAPVSPNIKVNVLLAVVFGLMLAIGAAVLADSLDTTVRDPEMVSALLGSEVLGMLPKVQGASGSLIPAMLREAGPNSRALMRTSDALQKPALNYLESVKTLHASLMLADIDQRVRTMMVTSAAPAEGKSTVATAIAISHAAKGKRVLLIDGDLRRPSLADKLRISSRQGLVDVCLRGTPWRDVVHPLLDLPDLHVLATGACNRRAIDPFAAVLADLLAEATDEYDLIVVDSPPLLGFPEPLHVASLVDGVLLVALSGNTNRKALQLSLNQLRRIGAQTLGVVLNGATRDTQGAYYYHHYASHYNQALSPDAASQAEGANEAFEEESAKKLAS